LKESVYRRLKASITRGQLVPGSKLVETEIAKSLGVSRTPLREAINRLELDGLIEIFPHRGAFVKRHSVKEILENLEIREVLEGLAVRLAAKHSTAKMIRELESCFKEFTPKKVESALPRYAHRNVRFHNQIIAASRNQKLIALIHNLFDQMDIVRLNTIALPGRARKSLAEHQNIIRLIKEGKAVEAERYLRAHICDLRHAVLKLPRLRSPGSTGQV
jgi:DNA-binding GntR family transcriptional regulator